MSIARLHDAALALVFNAVVEDASFSSQQLSLALPLALSHVCLRWRAVALSQPRLWAVFCWQPGDDVDAALAVLQRSGAASLYMKIDLCSDTGSNSDTGTATLLGAVTGHLWRATHLRLDLSRDSLRIPFFSGLFGSSPLKMPRLQSIHVSTPMGVQRSDIPRLNIECSPLTDIFLSRVLMPMSLGIVGPGTTHLDFSDLRFTVSELHAILSPATSLKRFALLACDIRDDSTDLSSLRNLPLSPPGLDEVSIVSGPASALKRLRKILLPARAREVGVYSFRTEIPPEAALEFLDVGKLGNIASLEISRDSLQFKNAAGMERNIGGELDSFDFLYGVVAENRLLVSLRELQTSLHCWTDLMRLFTSVDRYLPNLEEVRLWLSQDSFEEDDAPFDGDRILAPSLRSFHVSLSGEEMPTAALVRHYICAVCCFLPSSLAGVTVSYHNVYHEDQSLLGRFFELYELEQNRLMASIPRVSR